MPSLINKFYTFDISKISHNIIQYVDDSTNIVASSSHIDLQNYINTYFLVLEEYYNINKLLINSDKSKLLIIAKNNLRGITNSIKLQANQYVIEQSTKIKVLGIYI